MFEGRAAQVGVISLLSTGEAGGQTRHCGVLICCEECSSSCVYIYLL